MARCPNCGGNNFRYELRAAGTRSKANYYRTGVKSSWFIPSGQKNYQSQRQQKAVGICRDCGYCCEKDQQPATFIAVILLCVIAVLLIALVVHFLGSDETKNDAADVATQNNGYAPLSDFNYYVDEDGAIVLKAYKGRSSTVRIQPSYEVDGSVRSVVGLDGTFAIKSVDNVIVPEGVVRLSNNVFNSSGIKNVYFPTTLTDFAGWNYFYDVQKIYYGGTKEQWNALYTGERSKLDVTQIVYEASVDAIEFD